MRKLIASFAVSLDGYIEGPNGEIDWINHDREQSKRLAEQWEKTDALFYRKKTYEAVLSFNNKSAKSKNPFGHQKNYVFSNSLQSVADEFVLINGDTKEEVEKIKNRPGKNIVVFGGSKFTCALINLALVDELALAICPVILGNGRPLFNNITARTYFTLKEAVTYNSGLVSLSYEARKNNDSPVT